MWICANKCNPVSYLDDKNGKACNILYRGSSYMSAHVLLNLYICIKMFLSEGFVHRTIVTGRNAFNRKERSMYTAHTTGHFQKEAVAKSL